MKNTEKLWMALLLKRLINLKHESFRTKEFPLFFHYQLKLKSEIPNVRSKWAKKSEAVSEKYMEHCEKYWKQRYQNEQRSNFNHLIHFPVSIWSTCSESNHITIILQLDLVTMNAAVAVISFNMSRAFNKLPHDKLFKSLLHAGLPHNFLRWLINYFQNRRRRI